MFAYCNNSPICFEDSTGTYRATVLGDKEYVAPLVPTTVGAAHAYSLSARNSGHSFRLFGIASSVNTEKAISRSYFYLVSSETGIGYNKSFDNNKKINFFTTVSSDFFNGFPISAGIDVNVDGYGGAIELGTNVAVSVHMDSYSCELGWDPAGHTYFKSVYATENGGYTYNKFSINGHECAATVLFLHYAPQAIPTLVYAFTKLVETSSCAHSY